MQIIFFRSFTLTLGAYDPNVPRMSGTNTVNSDELDQLLGRVVAKDNVAFKRLYDQSSPQLFAVLLRILPGRDLAEEALQDVYVRIWREAKSYRPERGKPLTWMVSIARNRGLDIRRRLGREFITEPDELAQVADAPTVEADPFSYSQWQGDAELLKACMEGLDANQGHSIRLAFMRGFTHREVSAALGVPLGTVKSWIRRGLDGLKACVGL